MGEWVRGKAVWEVTPAPVSSTTARPVACRTRPSSAAGKGAQQSKGLGGEARGCSKARGCSQARGWRRSTVRGFSTGSPARPPCPCSVYAVSIQCLSSVHAARAHLLGLHAHAVSIQCLSSVYPVYMQHGLTCSAVSILRASSRASSEPIVLRRHAQGRGRGAEERGVRAAVDGTGGGGAGWRRLRRTRGPHSLAAR